MQKKAQPGQPERIKVRMLEGYGNGREKWPLEKARKLMSIFYIFKNIDDQYYCNYFSPHLSMIDSIQYHQEAGKMMYRPCHMQHYLQW